MAVEFKGANGTLLRLDGLLTPEAKTRGFSLEDKAVWPLSTRETSPSWPSFDTSPGSTAFLLLQCMKGTMRDIQASLDRIESARAAKIIRRGQRLVTLRLTSPIEIGDLTPHAHPW
jgi:hypothetical protein